MNNPSGGVLSWFGTPKNDSLYLDLWRSAPLTYTPGQFIDENWHVDRYEVLLGVDSTGQLFKRAAGITLRNRFYPPQVMENISDFQLADRCVQVGDRVLQRIRLLMLGTRPLLETLTMNEITEVINEPRHKGFTYTTTAVHSEIGEWSPSVIWRENDEVALVIEVVSRSRPGSSDLSQRITRWMQLRAHRLSILNFRALLSGERYPAAQPAFIPQELVPVGMLAMAMMLFMLAMRAFVRRR
jgi:hypothetical protein